jgi:hypothetical protein
MQTERLPHQVFCHALNLLKKNFAALLTLIMLAGCGSKPTVPGARLAGVVTIDNQPVLKGSVAFTPTGNTRGKAVGVEIKEGRYDCDYVPKGDILVQIYALRPTGKRIEVMGTKTDEMLDILPKHYRNGFKIEVKEDNLNQDFKLTSSIAK